MSDWVSVLIHGWTTEPPYRVCAVVPDTESLNRFVWLSTDDVRRADDTPGEPGQT